MKTPCKQCPFLKGKAWYGSFGSAPNAASKIEAFQTVTEQGIFSCHVKNPDRNVFSVKPMIKDDCAGFRMMKENMKKPDSNPSVVNCFNDVGPDSFDLNYWAAKEKYHSPLLIRK